MIDSTAPPASVPAASSHANAPDQVVMPWQLTQLARAMLAAVLVAVPALGLYLRTLMHDVGYWDTAEFQAIGPVLGLAHPTGYPSYTLLAWMASVVLQPFGNEALRANLLSALLVAAGCGLVGATVAYATRRVIAGVAAGIGLAVCSEAWSIGLHADPHALHLFLAAALLALLVVWGQRMRDHRPADRWLIAAAAVFGVSLGNHGLTILLAPGIGLYVLVVYPGILRRFKLIAACLAALALTTVGLYLYLPIRSAMNPPLDYANPETLEGFRYVVFAEQFRGTFKALPDVRETLRIILSENLEQLGVLYVMAAVGLVFGLVRRFALVVLLVTWFAVNWWFALGYVNADIGRYYLVPLMSVAVLGGFGVAAVLAGAGTLIRAATSNANRRAYARVAAVALVAVAIIGPAIASVPARLSTLDESNDVGSRPWYESLAASLPPDSVIVSWWSYSTPLWYAQYVEGWRPDITIIDDRTRLDQNLGDVENVIDSYLGQRPVYLIRLPNDLERFEQKYWLTEAASIKGERLWHVDSKRTGATGSNL